MRCRMPSSHRQAVRVYAPSASGWVSQRCGSTCVRLKKFIEGIRIELIERLHDHISLQMITVVSYADATHACARAPSIPAAASSTTMQLPGKAPTR